MPLHVDAVVAAEALHYYYFGQPLSLSKLRLIWDRYVGTDVGPILCKPIAQMPLHVDAVVAAEALHYYYFGQPLSLSKLRLIWDRYVGTDVGAKCFDTPSQTMMQNVVA